MVVAILILILTFFSTSLVPGLLPHVNLMIQEIASHHINIAYWEMEKQKQEKFNLVELAILKHMLWKCHI